MKEGKKKKKNLHWVQNDYPYRNTHMCTHTRGPSVTEGLERMDVYFSNELGRHLLKVATGVREIIPSLSLPDRSPKGEPSE